MTNMQSLKEWANTTGIPRSEKNDDIVSYTGEGESSSENLNEFLKAKGEGKKTNLKTWNGKKPEEAAKNISNGLKATTQDKDLYTGMGFNPSKIWESHRADVSKPVTIHSHAFISTSHLPQSTASFSADREGDGHDYTKHPLRNKNSVGAKFKGPINHILKISVPKGTKASRISHLSDFPEENETLLDRGHKIEIHPHPEAKIITLGKFRGYHKLKTFVWHAKIVGHDPQNLD